MDILNQATVYITKNWFSRIEPEIEPELSPDGALMSLASTAKGRGTCVTISRTRSYALVEIYLEAYETYLIRKIETTTGAEQSSLRTSLEDYYRFVASFKIPSCVVGKNDAQILNNDDDGTFTIVDRYNSMYLRIANELTAAETKSIMRIILAEVKATTRTNLNELNNSIMDIIHVDPEFKMNMLTRR